MNILWLTHRGERYLGDPLNRHGLEQEMAKITNSIFAGPEWPLHVPGEKIEDTVDRLMPDVDWVIDRDDHLHVPKPAGLNVAVLVSDLHGKHSYNVVNASGHIDLLNRAGYRALFLRYIELHGTRDPVDIYRRTLKPSVYWLPWSYDPGLFYPRTPQTWDATFIGETIESVYPLRTEIKAELESLSGAYAVYAVPAPRGPVFELLISENFGGRKYANVLGRSKIFIFDSSIYRYPLMKFTEAMGSGCLVMSTRPSGADALGLIDGETYIEINESNWREKLYYYLMYPDEALSIADLGRRIAQRHHTHEARARTFKRYLTHELVRNI